jgi:hypothetical protein
MAGRSRTDAFARGDTMTFGPVAAPTRLSRSRATARRRGTKIKGRIVALDGASLIAPCSGQSVVWFRLQVKSQGTEIDVEDAVDFYVEDRVGRRTLVSGRTAQVVAEPRTFVAPPPRACARVAELLAERGRDFAPEDVYEEECLRAGDTVCVLRLAPPDPTATPDTPYRDVAASESVFVAAFNGAAPRQGRFAPAIVAILREDEIYQIGGLLLLAGLLTVLERIFVCLVD